MQLFYYPRITGKVFVLDKNESAHCIRVLRLTTNDFIHLTDGKGTICKARITVPDQRACVTRIEEVTEVPGERNYSLQIAISPTKNIDRFEWFIEKATEIGVDRIIPLLCKNSERRIIKEERLKKVMVSAMKQSLKAWIPEIAPMVNFESLVGQDFDGGKFIASGSESVENHLGRLYGKGSDVLILIGPEGDFQQEEMQYARENDFIPVSLGNSRLRTETAGLVACHSINLLNSLS
jgi:16S rRNA (uracil1498-N3)-methyltransferase